MDILNPFLLRSVSLFGGITLLWYGSSHASIAGLAVMFVGLAAAVGGVTPPRLSSAHAGVSRAQPVARRR
jgi:hypothetical protein